MMKKYRLASASEADHAAIQTFIESEWVRRIALSNKIFYDWQMKGHPASQGRDHSILVVDDQDAIKGYYGVNPRPFIARDGREYRGAELTTIIFSQEVRGSMLVWSMIRQLQTDYDALFGMNTTRLALPVFVRAGFKHIYAIERMIKLYRTAPFMDSIKLGESGQLILSMHGRKPRVTPPFRSVNRDELQELMENYRISGINHLARRFVDLEWRYLRHPYWSHDIFVLAPDNPKQRTLVVLRKESHEHFTVAHCLEVLPLGEEWPDLPGFMDHYAQEYAVDLIDIMTTLPQLAAQFWEANWLTTLNDQECRIPGLFNPLELREPPTGNMTHWSKIPGEPLLDLTTLYISKADADFDRPTLYALQQLAKTAKGVNL
jgi:hypothetical protein